MKDDKPVPFTEEEIKEASEIAQKCDRHFVNWDEFKTNEKKN